jgi:hypothetical protein
MTVKKYKNNDFYKIISIVMALKDIVIKECTLQKVNTSQSKLNLVVYPLDENGDLEPWVALKVYINDSLKETFASNDFWESKRNFFINNVGDEVRIQIRDVSENVRSKIKIVLINNSNQGNTSNSNQDNSGHFDRSKEEAIIKLKMDPHNILQLNEEQKNDIEIVKYAIMEWWYLIQAVWNELKNNRELAKIAIRNDTDSFKYLPDSLQADTMFVFDLLSEFWDVFWLSSYVRNEINIKTRLSNFYENKSRLMILLDKWFEQAAKLNLERVDKRSDFKLQRITEESILLYNDMRKKYPFYFEYNIEDTVLLFKNS